MKLRAQVVLLAALAVGWVGWFLWPKGPNLSQHALSTLEAFKRQDATALHSRLSPMEKQRNPVTREQMSQFLAEHFPDEDRITAGNPYKIFADTGQVAYGQKYRSRSGREYTFTTTSTDTEEGAKAGDLVRALVVAAAEAHDEPKASDGKRARVLVWAQFVRKHQAQMSALGMKGVFGGDGRFVAWNEWLDVLEGRTQRRK